MPATTPGERLLHSSGVLHAPLLQKGRSAGHGAQPRVPMPARLPTWSVPQLHWSTVAEQGRAFDAIGGGGARASGVARRRAALGRRGRGPGRPEGGDERRWVCLRFVERRGSQRGKAAVDSYAAILGPPSLLLTPSRATSSSDAYDAAAGTRLGRAALQRRHRRSPRAIASALRVCHAAPPAAQQLSQARSGGLARASDETRQ